MKKAVVFIIWKRRWWDIFYFNIVTTEIIPKDAWKWSAVSMKYLFLCMIWTKDLWVTVASILMYKRDNGLLFYLKNTDFSRFLSEFHLNNKSFSYVSLNIIQKKIGFARNPLFIASEGKMLHRVLFQTMKPLFRFWFIAKILAVVSILRRQ